MNKPILEKNNGLTNSIETFHNCRKKILRAPEVTNPKKRCHRMSAFQTFLQVISDGVKVIRQY